MSTSDAWLLVVEKLTSLINDICIKQCPAICCNFKDSQFLVEVNMYDYDRLAPKGHKDKVIFSRQHGFAHLKSKDNGDCIFLDPIRKKCAIYKIRPFRCKMYPFQDPASEESNCLLDQQFSFSEKFRLFTLIEFEQLELQDKVGSKLTPDMIEFLKKISGLLN